MPERWLLVGVVLPLWWIAGGADWWLHRRSGIEDAGDPRESLLHLLMLAEVGVPTLALLVFEVDAWLLLLCVVGFLAHELTVYVDLQHAEARRAITSLEQVVHSFQELLPLAACLLLFAAHWSQALALLGLGDEAARWRPRVKAQPWPDGTAVGVLAGSAAVVVLYIEELWRCRGRRRAAP